MGVFARRRAFSKQAPVSLRLVVCIAILVYMLSRPDAEQSHPKHYLKNWLPNLLVEILDTLLRNRLSALELLGARSADVDYYDAGYALKALILMQYIKGCSHWRTSGQREDVF